MRTFAVKLSVFIVSILMAQASMAASQVPFGDVVSDKVYNYHRHTPYVATSGKLAPGALEELKSHGFKTIVDLRTVSEGTSDEAELAKKAELSYHNIPVGKSWPTAEVFTQFKTLVENEDNYPMLIHCGSANRVGMVWTMYKLQSGVAHSAALMEGRTIGMKPSREDQLEKNIAGQGK